MATRPSPPSGKLAGRRMVDAMRVEESIGIDRPVQEVFEYVSEADNFPEWTGTAIEVRKRAPGPFGKATPSRPLSSSSAAGSRRPANGPPTNPTGASRSGPRAVPSPTSVGPTPSKKCRGTRLTRAVEGEPGGFFKLADPLIERALERQVRADLETR